MNDLKLRGRTALVTGASRNIGRAIALAFAAEGADLVLNTRANAEELEAVAAECRKAGVRVVTVLADVADATACEAMVRRGLAELGAIDVLVCNAAIRPHKAVTDTPVDEWDRVLAVDLSSAFYLARAVVPAMKEHRRGSIIAIGGQSSVTSRANTAAVTAAKTGLLGLVRARDTNAGDQRPDSAVIRYTPRTIRIVPATTRTLSVSTSRRKNGARNRTKIGAVP